MKRQFRNFYSSVVLAFTALLIAAPAQSNIIVLDFEGIGDNSSINEFYNGGTDSDGNSGTDFGISFNSDALGLIDSDAGGTGNFANEPSGDTVMFFIGGTPILNFATGFENAFSFFFATDRISSVSIFDDIDGTGNLLATIGLDAQAFDNCNGDPFGVFCNFTAAGATFNGLAKSIDFGTSANQVAFDDLTFGSITPGAVDVPAPAGVFLFGLGGLLVCRLSKAKNK
jgi:hypothetical protein